MHIGICIKVKHFTACRHRRTPTAIVIYLHKSLCFYQPFFFLSICHFHWNINIHLISGRWEKVSEKHPWSVTISNVNLKKRSKQQPVKVAIRTCRWHWIDRLQGNLTRTSQASLWVEPIRTTKAWKAKKYFIRVLTSVLRILAKPGERQKSLYKTEGDTCKKPLYSSPMYPLGQSGLSRKSLYSLKRDWGHV